MAIDEETKSDLIGFALAVAVTALQQAQNEADDEISGMMQIFESDYSPEVAAALLWTALVDVRRDGQAVTVGRKKEDGALTEYWQGVADEMNNITADMMERRARISTNVIDFMAHYRQRREASSEIP